MYRPRPTRAGEPRPGIILMVVLVLLTLFAIVGLSFVLYADSQAKSAQIYRESEVQSRPDLDPELLLAYFLGQLIYDVKDDSSGVWSALRGHSLARLMYGYNDQDVNNTPFNGTGRLHTGSGSYMNPFQLDDYYLINYGYFPGDGFLRDPERLGVRTGPGQPHGPFTGGFNPPYTYPDLNNMFLAAVRADGTLLLPSFHRPWTGFASLDPGNANWYDTTKPWLKYLVLRPRPADMGPGFPAPEDAGGDVKNLIGSPGGNDSIWLDLDAPVQIAPDGRKYKPLFAPLIIDLDGRVNVNVHGNVRGIDLLTGNPTHVSNQGWGPWEVNLGQVLSQGSEWANLFVGTATPPLLGRYGGIPWAGQIGTPALPGTQAQPGRLPHFYGQIDFDACQEQAGFIPSLPLQLPGMGAPPLICFPLYPGGYGNGSVAERTDHPLLYNLFQPVGDDRRFALSNMEALLRSGGTGSATLTSELLRLCPNNFADPRSRRLVTTDSFDRDQPGMTPWVYDPSDPRYLYHIDPAFPEGPPLGPAIPFPALAQRLAPPPPQSEFSSDWRAASAALGRFDLNADLPPFPHQGSGFTPPYGPPLVDANGRFDAGPANGPIVQQFYAALGARQELANAIYRRLLSVTGVAPPADPAHPSDTDLLPRRWLAQLAANIVDYIDEDEITTPFNFYTTLDAGDPTFDIGAVSDNDPELPKYWVFGTELPHVVLNEALVETPDARVTSNLPNAEVRVWVELENPFQVPPAGSGLQEQDGLAVLFRIGPLAGPSANPDATGAAYSSYRLVLAQGLLARPANDSVLGEPGSIRSDNPAQPFEDFSESVTLMNGDPQPPPSPSINPQGFFLLGPQAPPNPLFRDPFVATTAGGKVPPNTPVLRSANLLYHHDFLSSVTTDERTTGLAVLLRRLTDPHIPFDPHPVLNGQANPWYNPYLTVDYLEKLPLQDAATHAGVAYPTRGKRQPYGALTKLLGANVYDAAPDSPVADQTPLDAPRLVEHTFGMPNDPPPPSAHYDWLVHLDRKLISPMEVLHVSGYHPHQLTQQFLTGDDQQPDQRFQHYVSWFDPARRLYRIFEFLETHDLAAGSSVGGRIPGKINLNTIWDPEVFRAICDPQNPNNFTLTDVDAIFQQMLRLRTPDGVPGAGDRPFLSSATGITAAPDAQYPRGIDIEDTFLRSFNGGTRRLLQPPLPAASDPNSHPYLQYQLLTKIFNHLTARSNVFAIWVTVGFFEVTDDTTRPIKLGPEIGRGENRHIRHRLFAIVDRSALDSNPGPQERFNPRTKPTLVPYFSVID